MSKLKAKQHAKQVGEVIHIAKEMAFINGADSVPIKIDCAPAVLVPVKALDSIARVLISSSNDAPASLLSDEQFDALAKLACLQPGSNKYTAAYRHLVNGEAAKDIAKFLEMPYTNAWDAIKIAKAKIELCKVVAGND